MKKLLCLLISFLPIVVCAQSWQILNPRPTGDELRCVFFFNSQTGYIAGENTVIKTGDGGSTWNVVYNGFLSSILHSPTSDLRLQTSDLILTTLGTVGHYRISNLLCGALFFV
jgi:hypothetical protein